MTMLYTYTLGFVTLSGLGIVFLSPETILALCFFVFFTLLLRNIDGQSFESTRRLVLAKLVSCMLDAQKRQGAGQRVRLFQKANYLQCIKHLKM